MSVGLLLIRHAETDAAGTFCGHADPPVNARGTAQIEELVAKLACYQVEVVYSSDLRRALATAEAVATYFSVPLKTTSNLREIGFGDWENATWSEIEVRDPAYAKRWMAESPRLAAPHGEEFDCFEERALKAWDGIAASHQKAAIVTHAGVLRVFLTRRCGLTDEQAWMQTRSYCSVFAYLAGGNQRHDG